MTKAEQRRVMREDVKRRNARDIADFLTLHKVTVDSGCDPYHVSRGITGEASANNRTHRATDTTWENRYELRTDSNGKTHARKIGTQRAVGTACDTDGTPILTPAGGATVRVITPAGTTIRPLSSFKREHVSKRTKASVPAPAIEHRIMAADLAPIGNVE